MLKDECEGRLVQLAQAINHHLKDPHSLGRGPWKKQALKRITAQHLTVAAQNLSLIMLVIGDQKDLLDTREGIFLKLLGMLVERFENSFKKWVSHPQKIQSD